MSISTYSELKTAVANWIHRDDLTSLIPDFISLTEARIARDLRLRRQVTSSTLTATPGTRGITLPTGWLEFENVTLATNPERQLTYVNIEHLDSKYPQTSYTGVPAVFSIEANQILLGPTPDDDYTVNILYYAKFDAFSAASDTNWLLTNHPNIYLFGALAEAGTYTQDERAQLWEARYAKESQELQTSDDKSQFSGTSLRVRTIY